MATTPSPAHDTRRDRLQALRDDVVALKMRAIEHATATADVIAAVHPSHRAGAANLVHYLALRAKDLRPLQERLAAEGLSSLGRMEPDVLANIEAVESMLDDALSAQIDDRPPVPLGAGRQELRGRAAALLAPAREHRSTRIMVTLPADAADDADMVRRFADAGMDLARINCSHDDPDAWERMADNVHGLDGRPLIAMDLGGPKPRTGTILPAKKKSKKKSKKKPALRIHPGDLLTLTADPAPVPATDGDSHRVSCTLPAAVAALEVGHRVAFDDGVIVGSVVAVRDGEADIRITLADAEGTKLRAEKGINLPDSELDVPSLTDDDRVALPHVIRLADIVQLSFTRTPQDVRDLFAALAESGAADGGLGVVIKIETPTGFQSLPELLFELMKHERVGVMIARGDLGVEVGFARLAEVQEEMLWLCEAAHIPVIWATEVLDSLASTGVPTRAEITDAAAGNRAECVMLNKGPFIVDAIRALDDILSRMHGHVRKKRTLLRRLTSWAREDLA